MGMLLSIGQFFFITPGKPNIVPCMRPDLCMASGETEIEIVFLRLTKLTNTYSTYIQILPRSKPNIH